MLLKYMTTFQQSSDKGRTSVSNSGMFTYKVSHIRFFFHEYDACGIPTNIYDDQQCTCMSASGDSTNESEGGATELSFIDSMQEISSRGPRYKVLRI